jgi:hypothetical protein
MIRRVKSGLTTCAIWRKVSVLQPASNAIVRRMDGKRLLAIMTPESVLVLSVFFNFPILNGCYSVFVGINPCLSTSKSDESDSRAPVRRTFTH